MPFSLELSSGKTHKKFLSKEVVLRVFTECKTPGTVALTWDDGPVASNAHEGTQYWLAGSTPALLDLFKLKNIKVTYFIIANRLINDSAKIDAALRAMNEGHEIGSHSLSHADFVEIYKTPPANIKTGCDAIRNEIKDADDVFRKYLNVSPRYIRPPYGSIDIPTANILYHWGYETIVWNMDTYDWFWDQDSMTLMDRLRIVESYKTAFAIADPNRDSFITLQHDRCTSLQGEIERYNYIIDMIHEKGFRFVTMSECLGDVQGAYFGDSNKPNFEKCNPNN